MNLFLAPLLLTALWSLDPAAGLHKVGNLLLSATLGALLAGLAAQRVGLDAALRWWLAVLALLLTAALGYKLVFGFADRDVPFLMLGPIVFARFMGLGAILAACLLSGPARVLGITAFSLGVLWTASKGPLLALAIVAILAGLTASGMRARVAAAVLTALAAGTLVLAADWLRMQPLFGRFFVALQVLDTGLNEANWGSIGSRLELLEVSLHQIAINPLGVGIGSWAPSTGLEWAEYPHNFFMEVLAEGGLIAGAFALIPFLWFFPPKDRVLTACCVFLAIGQQFSGDLLDARIWLTLSTLGLARRVQQMPGPTKSPTLLIAPRT
jgi:hypothetical protein